MMQEGRDCAGQQQRSKGLGSRRTLTLLSWEADTKRPVSTGYQTAQLVTYLWKLAWPLSSLKMGLWSSAGGWLLPAALPVELGAAVS